MGRPKLMLPWGNNGTILDRVLSVWVSTSVADTLVVVPQDSFDVRQTCATWGVTVVTPDRPTACMSDSVEIGLSHLVTRGQVESGDYIFICPADIPGLTPEIIHRLLNSVSPEARVVVPMFGTAPGHPLLVESQTLLHHFRHCSTPRLDQLLAHSTRREVVITDIQKPLGVNTPTEYDAARRALGDSESCC